MAKFQIDEIIKIKTGKTLSRNYKGYKGTFATLVYNCVEKRVLPGFQEEALVITAEKKDKTLAVKLSGKHPDQDIMNIMDIALTNVSAFPVKGGRAHYSITIE